jgi:hypothetical protein
MTQQRKASRPADRWRFFRDAADKWRWQYIMQGKAVAQAYEGFAEYADCVANARAHGYREPVNRES